jgi:5-formyltetrahydrofolate cyclo-ligase
MEERSTARARVWEALRKVAKPDSRFHWDFSMFIPDYEGSERCMERIRRLPLYHKARIFMITPDNNLMGLRAQALRDWKTYLMPTYGIRRGFLLLNRSLVPEGQEELAATLDGADLYGRPLTLKEIRAIGWIDALITGASIVNLEGVRYGKGHGYFDLEWGMLRTLGVVDESTPVVAVVHDCQLVEEEIPVGPYDTIVDYIVTPSRLIEVARKRPKPTGIDWSRITPQLLEEIPPLRELKELVEEKGEG